MVRLEHVSKSWGYRSILKQISCRFREGECTAILGANGAGKSTLLKLIATLAAPSEGDIWFKDQLLKEASPSIRREIGYMFHQSSFYAHLTAVENLHIVCQWYGVGNANVEIASVLNQVGLRLAKEEKVQNFSRGMVQRLSIARILLMKPALLLLDEPHTGLDQEGIWWFNELIKERLAEGVTVLMVSHDLGQVKELADRVLWLEQGRIVKDLLRADAAELEFQRQVSSG